MATLVNLAANTFETIVGKRPVATGTTETEWREDKTMDAIIWKGPMKVAVEKHKAPKITHPKDAIIKVTATTLCGSDLHLYTNDVPNMKSGDILGHEAMGIVEEVGPEVKNIKTGDRVVISFNIACGECSYCKKEEYTACDKTNSSKIMEGMFGHRTTGIFGYSHLTGGYAGCQAGYVRVPFADVNLLVVDPNLPDEKALYLSDIACTSYHGCYLGDVSEGKSVCVWGLGPVGMLILQWCKVLKAGKIIGIDIVPERIEMAKKIVPEAEIINASDENIVDALNSVCPGGVDVAIEAAGFRYANSIVHKVERAVGLETDTSEILNECIKCLRKFGRLVIIGDYVGFCNHFNIGAMMEKHLVVTGGQSTTQKHWKFVQEKMLSGEFDPTVVVNFKGHLSDLPKLYEDFYMKRHGIVKVFLRP